eukprot:gene12524-8579_t
MRRRLHSSCDSSGCKLKREGCGGPHAKRKAGDFAAACRLLAYSLSSFSGFIFVSFCFPGGRLPVSDGMDRGGGRRRQQQRIATASSLLFSESTCTVFALYLFSSIFRNNQTQRHHGLSSQATTGSLHWRISVLQQLLDAFLRQLYHYTFYTCCGEKIEEEEADEAEIKNNKKETYQQSHLEGQRIYYYLSGAAVSSDVSLCIQEEAQCIDLFHLKEFTNSSYCFVLDTKPLRGKAPSPVTTLDLRLCYNLGDENGNNKLLLHPGLLRRLAKMRPVLCRTLYAVGVAAPITSSHLTQFRSLSVRTEDFFSKEAISHARRISWAPHTTEKKQGASFAKLARSNFSDPLPQSFRDEPFAEEEIEAYRAHHRPDIFIYKYNVSPTHMSLRG